MILVKIPLRELRPYKLYRSNDPVIQVLVTRLRKVGFLQPILVNALSNDILDGDKRYAALQSIYDQDWIAPVIKLTPPPNVDPWVIRVMLNSRLSYITDDMDTYIDPHIDAVRAAFMKNLTFDLLLEPETDIPTLKRELLDDLLFQDD